MKKPTPKTVKQVCTLCGLDWGRHGENPTTDTCVALLLEEIKSLNAQLAHRPISYPVVQPIIRPYAPYWPNPLYPGRGFGPNGPQYTSGGATSTSASVTQGLMPTPRNVLS